MNRRQTKAPTSDGAPTSTSPANNKLAAKAKGPRVPHNFKGKQHTQVLSTNVLFIILVAVIALIYGVVVFAFYQHEESPVQNIPARLDEQQQRQRKALRAGDSNSNNKLNNNDKNKKSVSVDTTQYPYWRDLAVKLAAMTASETLKELNEKDPFGTRQFEKDLLEQETKLGRLLEHHELEQLFPCPSSRITLPEQRNLQKAQDYRNNKPGTFLFFQFARCVLFFI